MKQKQPKAPKVYFTEWPSAKSLVTFIAKAFGILLVLMSITVGLSYLSSKTLVTYMSTNLAFLQPVSLLFFLAFAFLVLIQRPTTKEIVLPFIKKPSAQTELKVVTLQKVTLILAIISIVALHL